MFRENRTNLKAQVICTSDTTTLTQGVQHHQKMGELWLTPHLLEEPLPTLTGLSSVLITGLTGVQVVLDALRVEQWETLWPHNEKADTVFSCCLDLYGCNPGISCLQCPNCTHVSAECRWCLHFMCRRAPQHPACFLTGATLLLQLCMQAAAPNDPHRTDSWRQVCHHNCPVEGVGGGG